MLKQPGRTTGHFKNTRIHTTYENSRRNSSSSHRQHDNASITKNHKNHTKLIDQIRRKTIEIEQQKWNEEFTWIKAHAGLRGNELADKLAKNVASNKNDD
jgi:ribonuclease HI